MFQVSVFLQASSRGPPATSQGGAMNSEAAVEVDNEWSEAPMIEQLRSMESQDAMEAWRNDRWRMSPDGRPHPGTHVYQGRRLADPQGVVFESDRHFQGLLQRLRHHRFRLRVYVYANHFEEVWAHYCPDSVDTFMQHCDEGHIPGIPHVTKQLDGTALTTYVLVLHEQILRCGQFFSELAVSDWDIIELYLTVIHPDSIVTRRIPEIHTEPDPY